MVQILDQSNGTGGFVNNIIGGINEQFIEIIFHIIYGMHFRINIYGEPPQPNHLIMGELTNTSFLLHS